MDKDYVAHADRYATIEVAGIPMLDHGELRDEIKRALLIPCAIAPPWGATSWSRIGKRTRL